MPGKGLVVTMELELHGMHLLPTLSSVLISFFLVLTKFFIKGGEFGSNLRCSLNQ